MLLTIFLNFLQRTMVIKFWQKNSLKWTLLFFYLVQTFLFTLIYITFRTGSFISYCAAWFFSTYCRKWSMNAASPPITIFFNGRYFNTLVFYHIAYHLTPNIQLVIIIRYTKIATTTYIFMVHLTCFNNPFTDSETYKFPNRAVITLTHLFQCTWKPTKFGMTKSLILSPFIQNSQTFSREETKSSVQRPLYSFSRDREKNSSQSTLYLLELVIPQLKISNITQSVAFLTSTLGNKLKSSLI